MYCLTCNNLITNRGKKFCSRECFAKNNKQILQNPENCSNTKLMENDVQEIIKLYIDGISGNKIAKQFNVSSPCISAILTGKSWKDIKRPPLVVGSLKDRLSNYPNITERQMEIIIGSLLGDGYIVKQQVGNCRFGKKQRIDRVEYIQWLHKELMPYSRKVTKEISSRPVRRNGRIFHEKENGFLESCCLKTCNHPTFNKLRDKWYNKKIKVIPSDIKLTPLSLAVWFCDDGTLNKNEYRAVLCTDSFNTDEIERLRELLFEFDIKCNIYNSTKRLHIERKKDVDNLLDIIKPYITWDCFKYKIGK